MISGCSGLFSQWQRINVAVVTVHFAGGVGGRRCGEEGRIQFPSARFSDLNRSRELASCDGAAHQHGVPCVRTSLVHDNLIRISCGLETHSHNVHFFVPLFGSG